MSQGPRRGGLRLYGLVGLVLGLALTVWVIRRSGASLDPAQLASAWPALLLATLWFSVPLGAASQSWRHLFPARRRPSPRAALCLTWIGLGINWLLPVAMVGGELVKFRLGLLAGWQGRSLAASLIVDKTLQAGSQVIILPLGVGLLLALTDQLEWQLGGVLWIAAFGMVIGLFYHIQRVGLFSGLSRGLVHIWPAVADTELRAQRLDAAIRQVYRRRGPLLKALAWRLLFRLLMAGEVLLVLLWADPASTGLVSLILIAIALESLAQAARAMAFFIPGGLGAQEGALIGVGLMLGLPPELVLLIALIKRAREILVGSSALLYWQLREGQRMQVG